VGLLGIIHVKVDLLDNIDDVRMGRCQVLEGPTRRRPWHVCPPVLKPACGPPCQLAEEYREQTDDEWGRVRPPDVVRRLPKNDGGI
jgi:hypothetical protein